jgi:hypothetical protein
MCASADAYTSNGTTPPRGVALQRWNNLCPPPPHPPPRPPTPLSRPPPTHPPTYLPTYPPTLPPAHPLTPTLTLPPTHPPTHQPTNPALLRCAAQGLFGSEKGASTAFGGVVSLTGFVGTVVGGFALDRLQKRDWASTVHAARLQDGASWRGTAQCRVLPFVVFGVSCFACRRGCFLLCCSIKLGCLRPCCSINGRFCALHCPCRCTPSGRHALMQCRGGDGDACRVRPLCGCAQMPVVTADPHTPFRPQPALRASRWGRPARAARPYRQDRPAR